MACDQCHRNGEFKQQLAFAQCVDCHTPNPHTGQFQARPSKGECAECHKVDGWKPSLFGVKEHATSHYPLEGKHAAVACDNCHTPAFAAANCSTCHTTVNWTTATFDHSSTGFLLTNGHANVACALCHINNNYSLTIAPTDGGNSQCHLTTWQGTTTPVHSTSGSGFAAVNCSNCHTTAGWTAAAFDHSATGFTLTGTHMSPTPTPCASCHISNNYSLNSTDCYGCHQAAFQSTTTIGGRCHPNG